MRVRQRSSGFWFVPVRPTGEAFSPVQCVSPAQHPRCPEAKRTAVYKTTTTLIQEDEELFVTKTGVDFNGELFNFNPPKKIPAVNLQRPVIFNEIHRI